MTKLVLILHWPSNIISTGYYNKALHALMCYELDYPLDNEYYNYCYSLLEPLLESLLALLKTVPYQGFDRDP